MIIPALLCHMRVSQWCCQGVLHCSHVFRVSRIAGTGHSLGESRCLVCGPMRGGNPASWLVDQTVPNPGAGGSPRLVNLGVRMSGIIVCVCVCVREGWLKVNVIHFYLIFASCVVVLCYSLANRQLLNRTIWIYANNVTNRLPLPRLPPLWIPCLCFNPVPTYRPVGVTITCTCVRVGIEKHFPATGVKLNRDHRH